MSKRYGKDRVKSGLTHFVLGKAFSAIAGLLAMMLVIRELTVESFAAYSVLVALVEILTAISGLGLVHVLLRYVPELYAQHYQIALKQLVIGAIGLRTLLLLIASFIAYAFADRLAPAIGLGHVVSVFQAFLLVVFFRTSTHFLSQILESTLHQGTVQLGFFIATLTRIIGMLWLLRLGNVQLVDVIWIEAIGDALSLLVMAFGVYQIVKQKPKTQHSSADKHWLNNNLLQLTRFAMSGYLQHLAITPYGGHTNRLVGGGMLNVSSMASYGFAQSLYEYAKRYLPAQLLVGLIRPVVVSRYCEHRDFSAASNICEQVLHINILLIGLLFTTLFVAGSEGLAVLSTGKYGAHSLLILAMLFLVLLFETQRQQLELLVQTVERYEFLIASNVLLASSVLLAIVLVPVFGAVSFPVANIIGLLIANKWVNIRLKQAGFNYQHQWSKISQYIFLTIGAVIVGLLVKLIGAPWYIATFFAVLSYSLIAYWQFANVVKGFIADLLGNKVNLP
jgi:O-antigen/teichoic acid export membrane protein